MCFELDDEAGEAAFLSTLGPVRDLTPRSETIHSVRREDAGGVMITTQLPAMAAAKEREGRDRETEREGGNGPALCLSLTVLKPAGAAVPVPFLFPVLDLLWLTLAARNIYHCDLLGQGMAMCKGMCGWMCVHMYVLVLRTYIRPYSACMQHSKIPVPTQ